MGKRRIEQYLLNELSLLGDRFNERYPRKGFSYNISLEELGKQLMTEIFSSEENLSKIHSTMIDVALTALMIAMISRREQ